MLPYKDSQFENGGNFFYTLHIEHFCEKNVYNDLSRGGLWRSEKGEVFNQNLFLVILEPILLKTELVPLFLMF